jgi:copper chaperone NosL
MLTVRARVLVAVAALLLLPMFFTPIWRVYLQAPQYPEGIGMQIWINTVTGIKENDLDNINNLNHYIGMKRIEPDAIPELRIMPFIVGALVLTGAAAAALGRRRLAQGWVALFLVVSLAGLADFWKWEYDYGHDLDMENAIIKVPGMTYQPPLIGSKQLLNFTATSIPGPGGIAAMVALGLGVLALVIDRRRPLPVPLTGAAGTLRTAVVA